MEIKSYWTSFIQWVMYVMHLNKTFQSSNIMFYNLLHINLHWSRNVGIIYQKREVCMYWFIIYLLSIR